jgi:hypothetical protein
MKKNALLLLSLVLASTAYANHANLFFHIATPNIWPFNTTNPDLIVASGTTTLSAGQTYLYHNVTISSGAVLQITGTASTPTIIGASGTFTNNGTINGGANNAGTYTTTAPDGTVVSYTITQSLGGSGGTGGIGGGNDNGAGGAGTGGYGGGGGGGGTDGSGVRGGTGGSNNGSGGANSYGINGATGGNGGAGATASGLTPGKGGGSGGGAGGYSIGGGAGGGGGNRGTHGMGLFIRCGYFAGSGIVNFAGTNGYNGGGGGTATEGNDDSGGGGGGGGGAGGSGGMFIVHAKYGSTYTGSVTVSGGSGGSAGTAGAAVEGGQNGSNGIGGSSGASGTSSILNQ